MSTLKYFNQNELIMKGKTYQISYSWLDFRCSEKNSNFFKEVEFFKLTIQNQL